MFSKKLKIVYICLSFVTFLTMLLMFAFTEKTNQEKIFTKQISNLKSWSYTFYSQDWIVLAMQSGSTQALKKVSKDFVDAYTYAQSYYYKGKLINGFGDFPTDIKLKELGEGWNNYSKSIVLKSSVRNNIQILTFRSNPKGYIIRENVAKIKMSLKNVRVALPKVLVVLLVFNLVFFVSIYIQHILRQREEDLDKEHDFNKIVHNNDLLAMEILDAKKSPETLENIAHEIKAKAALGEAFLYGSGDKTKISTYSLRELLDQFYSGFFIEKDRSIFFEKDFRQDIKIAVDKRAFYKILLNTFNNAYDECLGHSSFSLGVLEGSENITFIIKNKTQAEIGTFKKSLKKGWSSKNSSGRGVNIVISSLKKMKKRLSIIKSDSTVSFSFDVPMAFDNHPWLGGKN